jgi:hypothetical protein
MSTRTYPLEIERLVDLDGDYTVGAFSRGHHEPETFLAAAVSYLLEERGIDDWTPEVAKVRHETWRHIPMGHDEPGSLRFEPAKPGARGAYPVTVIDYTPAEPAA